MRRQAVPWIIACFVLGVSVASLVAMRVGKRSQGPVESPMAGVRSGPAVLPTRETPLDAAVAGERETGADGVSQPDWQAEQQPTAPKRVHPLLQDADEVVLADGGEVPSSAGPQLAEAIRAVVGAGRDRSELAPLTIDYPQDESILPPEIVAPTFLWHEPTAEADTWLIDVAFGSDLGRLHILSPGNPPLPGPIDPRCISETNEVYQPTPYQASAKSWTPSDRVWAAIRKGSSASAATITIMGFRNSEPDKPLSRGCMTITTSKDPVGAPIFYRDVPLAPSRTERGQIKPLGDDALWQIAWRLRDISKPDSRLLLTGVPTCSNCHSFSADGATLAMDLDGPRGDKGAYVIAPIEEQMVIDKEDVISWNSFKDKPKDHKTIGFLSQISPDGRYVVTTLNESLYVCNFLDYKFLQVFYPTRGILAYYCRDTGEIKALPGTDDPDFVHCDPAWTPDGKHLVFARAQAMDPYPQSGELPTRANDPAETQIQYDLYRIPFNDGRGGKAEPIAGASENGMSNTFPKVSPDGKWLVFVKCRNGQLMRPDGKLWIVPAAGGEARQMRCNTWRMNSWHSFSPNSRWLVFSSKANTPYTQMFLTHISEDGEDSPPILIPNSTAANRAVNIPEFVNIPYDRLVNISVPAVQYLRDGFRGVELAKKGKLDEAMDYFEKAVGSRPDYLEGHVNAAVILLEKGMLDEAADRLNEVLQVNPARWDAHGNLGIVLARKGMMDRAIIHFQAALKINPDYLEGHANLASVLLGKGKLDEAMPHLQAVVKLDPNDPVGHFDLGNLLLNRGKFKEAADHFRKCVDIDPQFAPARAMLARALDAQKRSESAAPPPKKQTGVVPGNPKSRQ